MSWDEEAQRRWDELQRRAEADTLASEEQAELDSLAQMLDAEEWEMLKPAIERLRQERDSLLETLMDARSKNEQLFRLLARQEALVELIRSHLTLLLSEHERLKAEYQRIVNVESVT